MSSMTFSVRSKFMACYELRRGRPSTVTRKEIVSFLEEYAANPYDGIVLKFPSWLTTESDYRASRGKYRLPWNDLNEFYKNNPDFEKSIKENHSKLFKDMTDSVCSLY